MSSSNSPSFITPTTLPALAAVGALVAVTIGLSRYFLPPNTSTRTRTLFLWNTFSSLVHLTLEASFLYNIFLSSQPRSLSSKLWAPASQALFEATPPGVHFLGDKDKVYGSYYGGNFFATLWREYARADKRWGGSDLTVVSLEILTVGVMAPLAVVACVLLVRAVSERDVGARATLERQAWLVAVMVATGELYGGFMTFAPEWLTGSPNLDTSNWMYTWVYLFLFNTAWVFLPTWVIYAGWGVLVDGTQDNGRSNAKSVESKKSK